MLSLYLMCHRNSIKFYGFTLIYNSTGRLQSYCGEASNTTPTWSKAVQGDFALLRPLSCFMYACMYAYVCISVSTCMHTYIQTYAYIHA